MSTTDVLGADLEAGPREFGKKKTNKFTKKPAFQGYKIDKKKKGRFGGMRSEPGGFARGYQAKGGSKMKLFGMMGTMMVAIFTLQMMTQSNVNKKKQIASEAVEGAKESE